MEFDTVGGAEEDHNLFIEILFEERVEESETQGFRAGNKGVIVGFVDGRVDGDNGVVVVYGCG